MNVAKEMEAVRLKTATNEEYILSGAGDKQVRNAPTKGGKHE